MVFSVFSVVHGASISSSKQRTAVGRQVGWHWIWVALSMVACGGTGVQASLSDLRDAISASVSSPTERERHSRLVESVSNGGELIGLRRDEVVAAIGRGDACSRHPQCQRQGFDGDDWHYIVGQPGGQRVGALPEFIVGFDRAGRVDRTWNLRVH